MIIPSSIKVGGHVVQIIFPYEFKERNDLCGQYDHNIKEIRLSGADAGGQKVTESQVITTLIHEILHAVDKTSGHGLFNDNEAALDGISEGLFQILIDNKKQIMDFLDGVYQDNACQDRAMCKKVKK